MTVEELIEELQQLPGAAQTALVWVHERSEFTVNYSRGHVHIFNGSSETGGGYDDDDDD